MDVIYVVLPIALVLSSAAVAAFLWAVRSGQMDDLHSPAVRMALEDGGTDDFRAASTTGVKEPSPEEPPM